MPRKSDEDSIVALLKPFSGGRGVRLGIGDDAAVLRIAGSSEDLVVTTDMLLEGVDFRRSWISPEHLGHKALAVNLSDLAAMGARPRYYLVALALPPDVGRGWIRRFYSGMQRLSAEFGAALAGGDLSRSPGGIQITVVALGETAGKKAVGRGGGRAGDVLFATGTLGKAAAGLRLLENGVTRGRTKAERAALAAQRTPLPRCEIGEWLADGGYPSCMMDLSDGISADLPRLCAASRTGASIHGDLLPIFTPSAAWGCDPVDLALHGGEDFELLFGVPAARLDRLRTNYPSQFPPATIIGSLTPGRRVVWFPGRGHLSVPLPRLGFDHFAPRR